MRETDRLLSRRAFTGSALATATLLAAGAARGADMRETPTQTIGPFYPIRRLREADADLTWIKGHRNRAKGTVIEVSGRILDRHGNPAQGARLELWQCNTFGRYAHPNDVSNAPLDPDFQGFAALTSGRQGEWRITTIKPAGYDSPIGQRTPHIHLDVQGRAQRLITQMYFPEDAAANAQDAIYKEMGQDAALTVARADGVARYQWDIILMDG